MDVELRLVTWEEAAPALEAIRRSVFIEEQGVPEYEEWDDLDADAQHVLVTDPLGGLVGTGRLVVTGLRARVGRLSVMPDLRGQGIGELILRALLTQARERSCTEVVLWAQVQAIPFYERSGFRAEGPIFQDAGIPHREMTLQLG